MNERRFRLVLAGLFAVGLLVRVVYALIADVPRGFGDDVWFNSVANGLVHGRGFSDPFNSLKDGMVVFGSLDAPIATAFHPPLFPALLAIPSALGLESYTAHQLVGCVMGATAIPVIGLVGRRVDGERAGIAAAGIAAIFIPLVARDSLLLSESLYGPLIALTLLAALRLRERPESGRRALELGVVVGLAALTRSEALGLIILLAAPLALLGKRRLRTFALVCAATAVVCLPWCVRNSLEFDQPTTITTGDGSVIAGANLPSTYHGDNLGGWDFNGLYNTPAGRNPSLNEAVQSDRWRSEGIAYARDHAGRLPAVLAARVLRTWELFPFSRAEQVKLAGSESKHVRTLEYPSQLMLLGVVLLAVAGGVSLRRRGRPVWVLLAPIVLVTLVSMAGHGDPRYRHAGDIGLVVLAGAGAGRLAMKGRPWVPLSRS